MSKVVGEKNLIAGIAGRVRIRKPVESVFLTDESIFIRLDDASEDSFWFQLRLDRERLMELLKEYEARRNVPE